jgi:hypothetical protein
VPFGNCGTLYFLSRFHGSSNTSDNLTIIAILKLKAMIGYHEKREPSWQRDTLENHSSLLNSLHSFDEIPLQKVAPKKFTTGSKLVWLFPLFEPDDPSETNSGAGTASCSQTELERKRRCGGRFPFPRLPKRHGPWHINNATLYNTIKESLIRINAA